MSVATEILYPALRLAGRLSGPGRGASTDDTSDALASLNRMLDSWQLDRLLVYQVASATYTWPAATASRTIGATGDFVATRPARIEAANVDDAPVRVLQDAVQWAALGDKTAAGKPEVVYLEAGFPNATLRLYRVPTAEVTLDLWTWTVVSQFATADDDVVLPPGYLDAIVNNLAVRIAAQFGLAINPEVRSMAIESKAAVQSFNAPAPVLRVDPALTGGYGYDILTDRF